MADILNFNPERNLGFDPDRTLGFTPGRHLQFNPGRELDFQPNRDLGFGHRGIVFRGYVCPICGALASEDATKCTECGAIFESTPRAQGPPVPAAPPESRDREKARRGSPETQAAGGPPELTARRGEKARFCAFCGAKLKPTDSFCWNCGARSIGTAEAVRLPAQKTEPTTREWRSPGEP